MRIFDNVRTKTFWNIWAVGYHSIKDYQGRLIELKLFIGPVVITCWR